MFSQPRSAIGFHIKANEVFRGTNSAEGVRYNQKDNCLEIDFSRIAKRNKRILYPEFGAIAIVVVETGHQEIFIYDCPVLTSNKSEYSQVSYYDFVGMTSGKSLRLTV